MNYQYNQYNLPLELIFKYLLFNLGHYMSTFYLLKKSFKSHIQNHILIYLILDLY